MSLTESLTDKTAWLERRLEPVLILSPHPLNALSQRFLTALSRVDQAAMAQHKLSALVQPVKEMIGH